MTRLPFYLAASALLAGCAATQPAVTDFTINSGIRARRNSWR